MDKKDTQSAKKLEVPSLELLEAELIREQYRHNYGKVLKSTVFSLLVVAAVAALIAVLLLPVLQISGTCRTATSWWRLTVQSTRPEMLLHFIIIIIF